MRQRAGERSCALGRFFVSPERADLVEYVFFPGGNDRFWAHGYDTVVDAAFAASDADDQRVPRSRPAANQVSDATSPTRAPLSSADLCRSTSAAADANALIERIEQAIAPSASQRIEKSLAASAGFQSRPTDKASTRGTHQGQRSCATASKGRTHDCKRPVLLTKITLAGWGPSTHEAASLKEKTPPERGSHGSIVAIKVRPWGARSTGSCRPAGRGRAAHSARSL
jgi:hypothetical protein